MNFEFFRNFKTDRVGDYPTQPELLDNADTEDKAIVTLGYEVAPNGWKPQPAQTPPERWPYRPLRFIDGKDEGRTIVSVRAPNGYPIPVRLAQIGATSVRIDDGTIRRETSYVERVVAFAADYFPWDEVEELAVGLSQNGFRLLVVPRIDDNVAHDFERQAHKTRNWTNNEMTRLERQTLGNKWRVPTLVDGRLSQRAAAFDDEITPVVGMIKTHSRSYIHKRGWQTFHALRPGWRTPAFRLDTENISVVTWYVRITGANRDLPNYGIVRLEIPRLFFEHQIGRNWQYLDYLSDIVCRYRHRDESYSRAAVSITPIVRAEEMLDTHLAPMDTLCALFYRLTNL